MQVKQNSWPQSLMTAFDWKLIGSKQTTQAGRDASSDDPPGARDGDDSEREAMVWFWVQDSIEITK